jgi:hypothetical protein
MQGIVVGKVAMEQESGQKDEYWHCNYAAC